MQASQHEYEYDVAVIGGGPAGAAATASLTLLGKRCVVIDPSGALSPMPTGTLSKVWRACGEQHGARDGTKHVEWSVVQKCMQQANDRVHMLVDSMRNPKFEHIVPIMEKGDGARIAVIKGRARLKDANTVQIDDNQTITADAAIVTVGSRSHHLKGIPFDDKYIFDSETIASIGRTPRRIVIQGAGIIGVEMAFVMRSFGAEVCLVEWGSAILAQLDLSVTSAIQQELTAAGVQVCLNAAVRVLHVPQNGLPPEHPMTISIDSHEESRASIGSRECDTLLSCTGRISNADSLDLERVGIKVDRKGCIPVHSTSQWTGVGKVYAAGDCSGPSDIAPAGLVTSGQAQAQRAAYTASIGECIKVDYHRLECNH